MRRVGEGVHGGKGKGRGELGKVRGGGVWRDGMGWDGREGEIWIGDGIRGGDAVWGHGKSTPCAFQRRGNGSVWCDAWGLVASMCHAV